MSLLAIDIDKNLDVRFIGHVNYTVPWMHFTRILDEYVMYIVKSGELYIKEGNTEYILKEGDMLLLEPNIRHTGYKEACCHYYYIHFRSSGIYTLNNKTFNEISQELLNKRKHSLTSDTYVEDKTIDTIYYLPKHYHIENNFEVLSILEKADYDFYQKYENYRKLASLKFHELIIRVCRNFITTNIQNGSAKPFIKVREIITYLESHYMASINSQDIEELLESNYDYLNRIFKKVTGNTIINYLNILRINRAKDLLSTTSIKFSEVGYLVGINDPYYFSKLFKKLTGMTPSQYVKSRSDMNL